MQAESIADLVREASNDQFWLGVLAADAPHVLATARRAELVHVTK